MSEEVFDVVQYFTNDQHEWVLDAAKLDAAITCAINLSTSVGGKIGTTRRVIVADAEGQIVWEWQYRKGMVWPVTDHVPEFLQARGPHEFDCSECGRHVIDFAGPVADPPRCACCIHVPAWYTHSEVANILDPEHQRTCG